MGKVCSKCKIEKDESEFYSNRATVDSLDYYCKDCRKHKTKNNLNYILDCHYDNREFIESLKTKCIKCGEDRPWVIQFHHLDPNTKAFNITRCGTRSKRSIWEESCKCVCLCSNCHDEFHHFFGQKPIDPVDSFDRYMDEDY